MARDILGEFGPEMSGSRSVDNRVSDGGKQSPRDVMNYAAPTGRAGSTNGPGLGGTTMPRATQDDSPNLTRHSGHPGIGGTNHGVCGSQK